MWENLGKYIVLKIKNTQIYIYLGGGNVTRIKNIRSEAKIKI